MKALFYDSARLNIRLILVFFLTFIFNQQQSLAAVCGTPSIDIVFAEGDIVATLLTLPCGGKVIQITDALSGVNSGGNATSETRTVYSFSPDNANGVPTYQGSAWPYIIVTGSITVDENISATLSMNENGILLINGWPAYQFVGDNSPVAATGVYGAWSYFISNGDPSVDACVEVFDCPDISANIGDECNDGDPVTIEDIVQEDCTCAGIPPAEGVIHMNVNWNTACGTRPVSIELYEVGTANHVLTILGDLDETGFSQTAEIPVDHYDVIIKVEGYLSVGMANFAIEPGDNFIDISSLTGGDINNNNAVNVADVSSLSAAFGSVETDENYNALGDFNCNGTINVVDVSSLGGSFGMVGVSVPLN